MKKLAKALTSMSVALVAAIMLIGLAPLTVLADTITVTIDGAIIQFEDQGPVIVEDRTLVPIRGVFEALDFYPTWNGEDQTATLTRSDYTIVVTIGSDVFTTNGVEHDLDVPAQIMEGSTMLPLRAVLESIGYYLTWDGNTRTVIITTDAPAEVPPIPPATEPTEPVPADEPSEPTEEITTDELPMANLSSYQQILDDFSAQLRAATPGILDDFRAAGANADQDELIDLSLEFISQLAEISVEGTTQMAELLLAGVGTTEMYMDYAMRLNDVYLEEAERISDLMIELLLG